MKPIDATWRETLDLLEVPNSPGLFVLGCFAERVTVYSQQVRALNLLDALCGMGYLHRGSRVAVVGAGFAGITAAAALAKIGASVALFDSQSAPMHLQLNCATRYIHPHIYDWPLTEIDDIDANLPILSWKARYARDLAKHIRSSWEEIRDVAEPEKVRECFGKRVTSISFQQHQWYVEVAHKCDAEPFDLVVLAVGFGVEKDDANSYSYWGDIPLNEQATHGHEWLISGAGYGALTDLMRLCVCNCDHENTLRKIVIAIETQAGDFIPILHKRVSSGMVGARLFEGLDPAPIARQLTLRKTPVKLNATVEDIFGSATKRPKASTLNRLVTWIMLNSGKVTLVDGEIPEEGISGQRGDLKVTLKGGNTAVVECEEVLVRHGPESVILDPNWLGQSHLRQMERLQRKWKKLYKDGGEDPTLFRKWEENTFRSTRLSPDVTKQPGLLLYAGDSLHGNEEAALKHSVEAVLKKSAIRTQLSEATGSDCPEQVKIFCLRAEEAVKDPRAFGSTLQALCRAPVLIVDGSDVTPAMAFLLGLRSAVRRGVTLLFRVGKMDLDAWENLAFNLRELRVIEVSDRASLSRFEKPLATALEEGLRRYARRPFHYADLPGFDALRNLGSHEDDTSIRVPKEEVLVLCPFDKDYELLCWPQVQRALRDHFLGNDGDASPARRVIDLESPETLNRRLFESIRRDTECIVDLTRRKPNVFFELGFRLAAHPQGARIIRCQDLQDAGTGSV